MFDHRTTVINVLVSFHHCEIKRFFIKGGIEMDSARLITGCSLHCLNHGLYFFINHHKSVSVRGSQYENLLIPPTIALPNYHL